jgi:hypothetical protein
MEVRSELPVVSCPLFVARKEIDFLTITIQIAASFEQGLLIK